MHAMKVKVTHIDEPNRFGFREKSGECPYCEEHLTNALYPNYCGFCGQKLVWGKKVEKE